MVYVPPPDAPFVLRSGVDSPTEGYWIDKYEISNAQHQMCVDAGGCYELNYADDTRYNGANYPVIGVRVFDAERYSAWVGGALPTSGELEYAAGGENQTIYPWGDEFDGTKFNFCDTNCSKLIKDDSWNDGHTLTAPVDSYPEGASWVGAQNMSGNVWEWTSSWNDESQTKRIIHGGSWEDTAFWAPVDVSTVDQPGLRYFRACFRTVMHSSPQ